MDEIMSREQAMGLIRSGTRASDSERSKVIDHLRNAHHEGRLTADQYHARSEQALAAVRREELASLATDLPAPQARRSRAVRATDAVTEFHGTHPALLWLTCIMSCAGLMAAATAADWGIAGSAQMWDTAWAALPVLTYIIAGVAALTCAVVWLAE